MTCKFISFIIPNERYPDKNVVIIKFQMTSKSKLIKSILLIEYKIMLMIVSLLFHPKEVIGI